MAFKDLRDFFDGSLELPVGGKLYKVPPISAEDGLWAQALMDLAVRAATGGDPGDAAALDDDDERNLYQRMLGSAYDEMITDGLDWPSLQRCGTTAYLHFTAGEAAALKFWEEGPGEAPAPLNREARRSATVTSIPSRGSTSGTKSPKKQRAATR